jgi:hypothetical protein
MTSQNVQLHDQQHVADLLPAYVNETLDPAETLRVCDHLRACEACRGELETWEALRDAAHTVVAAAPLPSINVLNNALAAIDGEEAYEQGLVPAASIIVTDGQGLVPAASIIVTDGQTDGRPQGSPPHSTSTPAPTIHGRGAHRSIAVAWWRPLWLPVASFFVHCWLLCGSQVCIIHKSIWIVTPMVIAFGTALSLVAIETSGARLQSAESVLSLVSALAAASSAAFLFGTENDPGLEITLSTPTSIRLVMLCRLALTLGYNIILAAIASLVIAVAHGGGAWEIMQTWLGPLLLLSSITLMLSVFVGSWFAMLAGILLESLRALPGFFEQHAPLLQAVNPASWPTNPTIVFLAVLFIVFAVFYAPRQPRLLR